MTAYYNEIDPYAAQWLRNLIAAGHIAPGDVDERSIKDVRADDLMGYRQCHFFAGIGVWSYALRLSGWPDDKPVWTGSCPCQPFSVAGKGAGTADERHLWPAWFSLIEKCKPAVVFGEQVEAAIRHGWLDLVQSDMEGIGYAFAAAGIPAAGFGAPHIRQRLWFVADHSDRNVADAGDEGLQGYRRPVEISVSEGRQGTQRHGGATSESGGVADAAAWRRASGLDAGSGDATDSRGQGNGEPCGGDLWPSPTNGHWRDADWLLCRDGKWRPVEPGTFPLAHGATARVGRLRAYGNAIVPQVAQAFIESYLNT